MFIFNTLNAQHLSDSTKYYLNINNNNVIEAINICIKDIYEWNSNNYHKNGVLNIYVSNEDNSCSMKVIPFYPQNDSVNIVPDYYSYLNGQIVFWYMGYSYLLTKNNIYFKNFVSSVYSKFVVEPEKILQSKQEEINLQHDKKKLTNAIETISDKDIKNAETVKIPNTVRPLIPKPPTFMIKITKNGRHISVLKENMVY